MGVVWAAVHAQTDRQVAVKLIHREASMNDALRERMLREARACGRVAHRNVIEILDAGITETGEPFLVMPLLRGETLADRLKRDERLGWRAAAQLGVDIARGLAAAHAAGIVHRDLKPGNIFLSYEMDVAEPVVKVLDFGVSKLIGGAFESKSITESGGVVGSPAYMSPEQVQGDRNVDHRSDLWSLGVVLFEISTGTFPFRGDSAFAVVAQILYGTVPSISDYAPDIDPRFAMLIERCLTRESHLRMGSASEVADLLKQLLETPGLGMPPTGSEPALSSTKPDLEREARRRPFRSGTLAAIASLSFLVMAGILALAVTNRRAIDAPNPPVFLGETEPADSSAAAVASSVSIPAFPSAPAPASATAPSSTEPPPARHPRSPASSAKPGVPRVKLPSDPG